MDLKESAKRVDEFEGPSLTKTLSALERKFQGLGKSDSADLCRENNLDHKLLAASFELKKLAGQINVVIHASGILAALPSILRAGEVVEYLSLGAGNTGKKFDLETNLQIAEFKFINWRGGPESIRQNSLFKDFFYLAEEETAKRRCLYVLGKEKPIKFLEGGRKLASVMSKNAKLAADFKRRYGSQFLEVGDYYRFRQSEVQIIDITPLLPELVQ